MKITYDYVKEYVESFGYKLISKEYINSRTKLDMICDKGHECSINWDNFKYGKRCKECNKLNQRKRYQHSYEHVKAYVESLGFSLLSKNYSNRQELLNIKCSEGHEFKRSFAYLQKNKICPSCKEEVKKKEKSDKTIFEIKEYLKTFGYKLISTEYEDCKTKLDMICDEGHRCSINWDNFKHGTRCKTCSIINVTNKNRHDYSFVKSYFESFDYELLNDTYVNQDELLKVKCPEGHKFEITYRSFREGSRCVICRQSKGEREVMRYLKKMNIKYTYDSKYFDDLLSLKGKPLRPDFILPEYKIWIEYDGEFHYKKIYENDNYETQKINDDIKNKYAKENNWKLIRIPYWEFDNIEKILTKELIKL